MWEIEKNNNNNKNHIMHKILDVIFASKVEMYVRNLIIHTGSSFSVS